jgi:ABC-type spermidine/putrescine transport system permease subunit I
MRATAIFLFVGLFVVAYGLTLAIWLSGLSTEPILETIARFGLVTIIERTIVISFLAAVAAMALGMPLAAVIVFGHRAIAISVFLLTMLSVAILLIPRALAWNVIAYVSPLRPYAHTQLAVIVVMSTMLAPVATLLIAQQLATVRTIHISAALTLGLSPGKTIWHTVVRPRLLGLVENLTVLVLIGAGYFVVPRVVGAGISDFVGNVVAKQVAGGDLVAASSVGHLIGALVVVPVLIIAFLRQTQRG